MENPYQYGLILFGRHGNSRHKLGRYFYVSATPLTKGDKVTMGAQSHPLNGYEAVITEIFDHGTIDEQRFIPPGEMPFDGMIRVELVTEAVGEIIFKKRRTLEDTLLKLETLRDQAKPKTS